MAFILSLHVFFRLHPQLVLNPLVRFDVMDSVSFPQSHLHRQTLFPFRFPIYPTTVRLPNFIPVKSLIVPIITAFRNCLIFEQTEGGKANRFSPRRAIRLYQTCLFHRKTFPCHLECASHPFGPSTFRAPKWAETSTKSVSRYSID